MLKISIFPACGQTKLRSPQTRLHFLLRLFAGFFCTVLIWDPSQKIWLLEFANIFTTAERTDITSAFNPVRFPKFERVEKTQNYTLPEMPLGEIIISLVFTDWHLLP